MLKNVHHVPKITKSLLNTGVLDDAGYVTIFGNSSWKISKGAMMRAHGAKLGSLYMLHVSNVTHHIINVIKQPNVSLWHCWLVQMSQKRMKILSCFGYISIFNIFGF